MKIKTITLTGPHDVLAGGGNTKPVWRVIKITDSLDFNPNQFLDKDQVSELVENKNWKVIITGDK